MPLAVFNWISIPWISCQSHSSAPISLLILNKFFQVIIVVQMLLKSWFALHIRWSGEGNAVQKILACVGTKQLFLLKLSYCTFPLLFMLEWQDLPFLSCLDWDTDIGKKKLQLSVWSKSLLVSEMVLLLRGSDSWSWLHCHELGPVYCVVGSKQLQNNKLCWNSALGLSAWNWGDPWWRLCCHLNSAIFFNFLTFFKRWTK